MSKKRKNLSSFSFVLSGNFNGFRVDIDYQRTVTSDGKVIERGLPAGMKPNPSFHELLMHYMIPKPK